MHSDFTSCLKIFHFFPNKNAHIHKKIHSFLLKNPDFSLLTRKVFQTVFITHTEIYSVSHFISDVLCLKVLTFGFVRHQEKIGTVNSLVTKRFLKIYHKYWSSFVSGEFVETTCIIRVNNEKPN